MALSSAIWMLDPPKILEQEVSILNDRRTVSGELRWKLREFTQKTLQKTPSFALSIRDFQAYL